MKIVGQDAEIYFGDYDTDGEGDWRTELPYEEDDEEELTATPQDVIDILGFDYRDEEPEEEETTVSLNTARAILILNAKKGWTDAARKKAALTRKAKKKSASKAAGKTPDYAKAVASAKGGGLYDSWKHTKVGKHKVKFAKIGDRYHAQSSTGMRTMGKTPEEAMSKLILRPKKNHYL